MATDVLTTKKYDSDQTGQDSKITALATKVASKPNRDQIVAGTNITITRDQPASGDIKISAADHPTPGPSDQIKEINGNKSVVFRVNTDDPSKPNEAVTLFEVDGVAKKLLVYKRNTTELIFVTDLSKFFLTDSSGPKKYNVKTYLTQVDTNKTNVATNTASITANDKAIKANTRDIANNRTLIQTNESDIADRPTYAEILSPDKSITATTVTDPQSGDKQRQLKVNVDNKSIVINAKGQTEADGLETKFGVKSGNDIVTDVNANKLNIDKLTKTVYTKTNLVAGSNITFTKNPSSNITTVASTPQFANMEVTNITYTKGTGDRYSADAQGSDFAKLRNSDFIYIHMEVLPTPSATAGQKVQFDVELPFQPSKGCKIVNYQFSYAKDNPAKVYNMFFNLQTADFELYGPDILFKSNTDFSKIKVYQSGG